ncbi:MAG TPA: transposase [Terriglobales bacterium]|nr:transposase [Terriglobales bacterium]
MTFYRRNLPHLQRDNKFHFITFCTYLRWVLPPAARAIVLDSCVHDHGTRYELELCVVMPDHVHLICVPLVDELGRCVHPLAEIMQAIKSASAHRINRALQRCGKIWQTESFDHVLRCAEEINAKIAYVRENPVRAGIVAQPEEYSWIWLNPSPHRYSPQARAPAAT